MSLNKLKILATHQGLKNKDFSCEELVKSYIKEIENKDQKINAYVFLNFQQAIEEAKKVDKKISQGEEIKVLEGLPVSVKDCFCVEGIESTAASNILKGYIPPYDATSVAKIKKQGSIILGKVNTDEFTMGASTETSAFGVTKNPHDLERVSGGSSGGSAASVSADMAMFSLATDTGGSIRQPANFCGVPGLKVTYGRISRYGVMSMASSLDTIGPIAKSVEDIAIVLEAIAGVDKKDSTTPKVEVPNYLSEIKKDIKGLKIGLPKEYLSSDLNSDVRKSLEGAIKKLKNQGAEIVDISLPHTKYAIATYYIIAPAEISSNMARYDGIRYGFSVTQSKDEGVKNLDDVYKKSRSIGFGSEVKRRIMLGTYTLSAGYYDAYYKKAMKVRTLIKQDFEQAFKAVDVIISPVTPGPAFKIGENINDPLQMYLEDIFTAPINLAGVPSLSVPFGQSKKLPLGVQIIGSHFAEKTILRIGDKLEN